jgi:hypothetical protein
MRTFFDYNPINNNMLCKVPLKRHRLYLVLNWMVFFAPQLSQNPFDFADYTPDGGWFIKDGLGD